MGYTYQLLVVKTNKGQHKYYYSTKLKCDVKNYENHKMGLWDFFTNKTNGALYIVSMSDLEDTKTYLELIALEIKELDNPIFNKPNLPLLKITKKLPKN